MLDHDLNNQLLDQVMVILTIEGPLQSGIREVDRKKEIVGYQEETCFFSHKQLGYHALVISQGWLSWSYALEGLGFVSLSTVASFNTVGSHAEFLGTSIGPSLISNHALQPWLNKQRSNGLVFVQEIGSFLNLPFSS